MRFPEFSGFLPAPRDCSIPDLFVLILSYVQFQICHSVSEPERRQKSRCALMGQALAFDSEINSAQFGPVAGVPHVL